VFFCLSEFGATLEMHAIVKISDFVRRLNNRSEMNDNSKNYDATITQLLPDWSSGEAVILANTRRCFELIVRATHGIVRVKSSSKLKIARPSRLANNVPNDATTDF